MTLTDHPERAAARPASGRCEPAAVTARKREDQTRNRVVIAGDGRLRARLSASIGGRLVMLGSRRSVRRWPARGNAASAVATARPDIVDRNGEILATDIRTASLYAEPNKIVDPDEATELDHASVLQDLDATALRKKLSTKAGFVWVKREIAGPAGADLRSRHSRRRFPRTRTSGSIRAARPPPISSASSISTIRASPASSGPCDERGLSDLHDAGFAMKAQQPGAGTACSIDLRVQHCAARRAGRRDAEIPGRGGDGRDGQRQDRRGEDRPCLAARFRPQHSRSTPTSRTG